MAGAAGGRIVLGIVLGLVVRGFAGGSVPLAGAAAPCEALLGQWKWFTGGVVSINPNGAIVYEGGNDGTWECTDPGRGQATLRWRVGGYVNRLALSPDGRALTSTDPSQWYVTGQRIGAPRTVEAPAPVKPAAPPRPADPGPPAKPSQPAKTAEPRPAPPGAQIITPPADVRKADVPPRTAPPSAPRPPEPGRPGPCSGNACVRVDVETADRCVWLRSAADSVVQAEVRLAGETVKLTLEKPDMAKVVKETPRSGPTAKQAATRKRFDELRRQGHQIPYDPKLEGPRDDARAPGTPVDPRRAWHGTRYDPVWMKDYPVFHARIDRAGGCVTDPGEILSYRVTSASAGGKEAAPPVIACVGEACADLDLDQVAACQVGNRGRRQIVIGMFRKGNDYATFSAPIEPGTSLRLVSIMCMRAEEIGKIEARYK